MRSDTGAYAGHADDGQADEDAVQQVEAFEGEQESRSQRP